MIVEALLEIQDRCGYLPHEELHRLAERLREPLHRIHEVASFYPHYRLQPPPRVDVKVCRDMSCHLRGSPELRRRVEAVAQELGAREICVGGASCLGQCDSAPAVVSINDHIYFRISEKGIRARLEAALAGEKLPHQLADCRPL